ncbi:cell wall synthase accessory phosphoprotein MacP [Streptococcus halichoeri]|uniref:cell wall synthase accessory phosphoprotein MacP n=1 Tax=Streptococcus halichoeri TaxID=254785 RepID=UPI001359A5D3|nr:cell wall synthase accessory phosphoprotein MacP [Streptococcus halichoeri]
MGKPLLSDDVIERANRGEHFSSEYDVDDFDTKVVVTGDVYSYDYEPYEDDSERIYKSRRIENEKRHQFQSKLNLLLIALVILIAILVYAIFNL